MAVAVCAGQIVTELLAAYALARWRIPGERILLFVLVASWIVSFPVTMLPNYVLLEHTHVLPALCDQAVDDE